MSVRDIVMAAAGASTKQGIFRVASSSTQNSAAGTSIVINKPSGVIKDDLLLAFIVTATSASATLLTGWTLIKSTGNNPGVLLAYKYATDSEPSTYTWSQGSSQTLSGSIVAYRNAVFDVAASLFTSSANPLVSTAITVTSNNSILIGFAARTAASISITESGSMTNIVTDNDATTPSYAIFEQAVNSGTTGTRSFTVGSATNVCSILFSLRPILSTPTYIGSQTTQNTVAGATVVINKPSGTAEGDLMVVFLTADGNQTYTEPSPWVEVLDPSGNPPTVIAYLVAGASEPSSYTFTGNQNTKLLSGSILTFRGAAYDTVGVSTNGSSSPISPAGITVSTDGSRLIGFCVVATASITMTESNSLMSALVVENDSTKSSYAIFDQIVASGATGTRTFVGTGNSNSAVLISIKPA